MKLGDTVVILPSDEIEEDCHGLLAVVVGMHADSTGCDVTVTFDPRADGFHMECLSEGAVRLATAAELDSDTYRFPAVPVSGEPVS